MGNYGTGGNDGGELPATTLTAAAAALPKKNGVTDEDVRFLVARMKAGDTFAQAKTALLSQARPQHLQPSDAALNGWQAEVTRRAALNYYPGT